MKDTKGQITLGVGLMATIIMLTTGGGVGYFSGNADIKNEISVVKQDISGIQGRMEENDKTFRDWLTRIEAKLDRVIEK